jgi:hypothetical protein
MTDTNPVVTLPPPTTGEVSVGTPEMQTLAAVVIRMERERDELRAEVDRLTLVLGEARYRLDRAIVGDPGWTPEFAREIVVFELDGAPNA